MKQAEDTWEIVFDAMLFSDDALQIMNNMDVESECEDACAHLQTSSNAQEESGIPSGGGSLPMNDDNWESFATAVTNRESLQFNETSDVLDDELSLSNTLPGDRDVFKSLSALYRANLLSVSKSVTIEITDVTGTSNHADAHVQPIDDETRKDLAEYQSKLQSI